MKKDFLNIFLVVLGYSIFHYFVCLLTSTQQGNEHLGLNQEPSFVCKVLTPLIGKSLNL